MAKTLPQDSQILLNILKVQNDINAVIEKYDADVEVIAADKKSVDLLTYYIIKMNSLLKYVSNKTKKDALSFIDKFTIKTILNDLEFCYPTIAITEIVKYAIQVSNEEAIADVKTRYAQCIETSHKYQGK